MVILDLASNKIKSLPKEIKKLNELKDLRLYDNLLSENEKTKIIEWLPNCEDIMFYENE